MDRHWCQVTSYVARAVGRLIDIKPALHDRDCPGYRRRTRAALIEAARLCMSACKEIDDAEEEH